MEEVQVKENCSLSNMLWYISQGARINTQTTIIVMKRSVAYYRHILICFRELLGEGGWGSEQHFKVASLTAVTLKGFYLKNLS